MSEVKLAVCAITDVDKQVLLLQRRDPRQLQLPGGRIEAGEVPAQAAIREVYEELDIAVTALHSIGTEAFTQGSTNYFCELFQVTRYEGKPHLTEPHIYEKWGYYNLHARRIGEFGLSASVENFVHLLHSEEIRLEG
jgi:8-oxo-dGTP pyrophosphatase MutT (NUDIX family)